MTDDNTTEQGMAGVIIVPNEMAAKVQAFAAKLAEEGSSEVEGFAYGMPELSKMGDVLGLRGGLVQSAVICGTKCKLTKAKDFSCADDDS